MRGVSLWLLLYRIGHFCQELALAQNYRLSYTQAHFFQTDKVLDSTGKPGQTRRFLGEIWTGMMLVHFLEWLAVSEIYFQVDWLIDWWSLIQRYSPLSWADSLRSPVVLHEWQVFIARFLNIHRRGVLKRWHGWCHMKLQPSRRKFCVHHTTLHHVTSCKATYVRCMRV